MNYIVIAIEAVIIIAVFTALVVGSLLRNPLWWIHDYPEDIQEEYFKTHERVPAKLTDKTVLAKKGIALLFAMVVFVGMALIAGAYDFKSAFFATYIVWLAVDWYDCFFLDWVLFANMKRIRLEGTEHMDKAYHQKKYHFIRSLIGMVLGLLPCIIAGVIVMLVR